MWIRDNSSNLFTECILCAKRSLGTEITSELEPVLVLFIFQQQETDHEQEAWSVNEREFRRF